MTRKPVSSTSIRSLGYDAENQILEVELKHGGVYQYFQVSADDYAAMLASESIGRYYTKHIKPNRKFRKIK